MDGVVEGLIPGVVVVPFGLLGVVRDAGPFIQGFVLFGWFWVTVEFELVLELEFDPVLGVAVLAPGVAVEAGGIAVVGHGVEVDGVVDGVVVAPGVV